MKVKGIIQQVDSDDYNIIGGGTFYLFCQYEGADGATHTVYCEIDEKYKNDFIPGDEIFINITPGVYENERILADEYIIDHPQNKGAYQRNHVKVLFGLPFIGKLATRLSGYNAEDIEKMTDTRQTIRLAKLSSCFRWLLTALITLICLVIAAPFTGKGFKNILVAIAVNVAFVAVCCLRFVLAGRGK
ncbi:MAG: hypothetical protein GX061_01240 [Eubacteriaceae bacterium]|nr:hypothetical protein [Eubacteriaceae bacterium]